MEAFEAHPKIGDVEGLRKKFGGFAAMSKNEQAGAAQASSSTIQVRGCASFFNVYDGHIGAISVYCILVPKVSTLCNEFSHQDADRLHYLQS